MRYLSLCVEVPEDLEKFDHFELLHDNGHSFFLFYKNKGNKVMRSFFPERIFCVSGDLKFVIERTIKFHDFFNYKEILNGLQKEDEAELVPKKFSARSRSKKS